MNNIKKCECGCGNVIKKIGSNGQERRFVKGHQRAWLGKKRLDMLGNNWGKNKDYFKTHKFKGPEHNNWKGGRWIYWRKQALIRDDYTCQNCGLKEKDILHVDHIEPIKSKNRYKINHDMNNLITLCPNCHARKTLKDIKDKKIICKNHV